MRHITGIMFTIGLLALLLVASQAEGAKSLQAAIEAANTKFMEGVAAKDADAVAEAYTEDALLMPPGAPSLEGRDAIRAYWETGLNGPVTAISLVTEEVDNLDGKAYEVGSYTLKGADGAAIDEGKYIVIWKLDDGDWKLHRDIWNSNGDLEG